MSREKEKNRNILRQRAEAILNMQPETVNNLDPRELRQVVHELHVHQIELEIQNEELRNTQKTLADTRTRYMQLYNNAPVGYVVLDSSGVIKQANGTFAQMVHQDADALRGRAFAELMVKQDETIFRSRLKAFFKNPGGKQMEVQFHPTEKGVFYATLQAVAHDDAGLRENQIHNELLMTISDATERKKLEARLAHAGRMETIGTLAGGIAHDYNNLLTAILGNLELVKQEIPSDSAISSWLGEMEAASLKARDLTHELTSLAKGGAPVKKAGSLGEVLRNAVMPFRFDERIRFDISVAEDLWMVAYDVNQVNSTLSSVISNAVDAMPSGGCISIDASNLTLGEDTAHTTLPLPSGNYVAIAIQDQGVGIPDKNINQIFDPYFSTKDMGSRKGMGLSLATVYSTIQKHNGHIEVKSRVGKGTRLTIYLPAEPMMESLTGESPSPGLNGQAVKRVLVMDDEEMLRNVATAILEHLSCEVETAEEGVKAIRAYREAMENEKPFDVVILDLTIKDGMGGREVIKELLQIDPNVKAIVCSGYFTDPIMADFREYGFSGALPKPYRMEELENILRIANV